MADANVVLDPDSRVAVINSLAEKLKANYIFPEVAEQICTNLNKHLADGDYSDIADGELFALALTMHLQEVNHDEHLWVRWHPKPLPEHEGQLRQNPEWQAERKLEAQLDNYGLHKVERLPGNIGYLDIHYFHRPAWGGETAVAAMNFLANTEALIIDLRACEGGYPGMIALISSYLFGEEAIHLDSIYWRDDDITQQYWTLPYIPGKRFIDKPVYILIGKVTFSGGEGFAYTLQARKRAVLVGEKTDGGANPGASYRLHPHFEAFIPVGQVINPLTGTNWEGCGVTPDIAAAPEQAFQVAYDMALKALLGEPSSGPLKNLAEEARKAN
ncbi:MAG TPA: S41 family peptidase [Anaerolineales bacterium]|nr:S41 family peptidase [Anaerolineales bacterium]